MQFSKNMFTQVVFIATITTIVLMLCAPVEVGARAASSFVTSTITVTVTSIDKKICGKLVNVTAACRRRRNFEFERPEILTFDEDIDEAIDLAFRNVYIHKQFTPTKTLGMEVTPLVYLPPLRSSARKPQIASFHSGIESSMPTYMFGSRNKNPYLAPSAYQQQAELQKQQLDQENRVFFSALSLANLLNKVTVTYTTYTTKTKTEVQNTEATFFVVGCTPNPFPFSVCAGKR
ncbi:uncharacterized protein LOC130702966 [Daphnia carinata]|uniref:uncharacterized protein LOC130702966 n=1 Tax=Daphnia carinata TaxID=120202 RepID=UPI0025805E62|nr:uncharacterized protein LOC130702966 [Daphnia carinata]